MRTCRARDDARQDATIRPCVSADLGQQLLLRIARFQVRTHHIVLWKLQARIARHETECLGTRFFQEIEIAPQVGEAQRRQAMLPRADEISRPAPLEIQLRDPEAVVGGRRERFHDSFRNE